MKVKRDHVRVRNAKRGHTQQSFIVAWGDKGDRNEGID